MSSSPDTRSTLTSPQGRFAEGAALLSGTLLSGAEALGKHLLHHYGYELDGACPPGALRHGDGRGRLASAARGAGADAAGRRWALARPARADRLLGAHAAGGGLALRARLGADPLRADAVAGRRACARIVRSPTVIAALLLDQSIIAGVGLVYASEVLFRAGIAPTRPGRSVSADQVRSMWADLRALMAEGVVRGRIDTVHSAHLPEAMGRAPRVDRHGGEVYVYRRTGQPCLSAARRCRGPGWPGATPTGARPVSPDCRRRAGRRSRGPRTARRRPGCRSSRARRR